MASNINPLYPAAGDTDTLEERNNFQAAKTEIEALQTGKSDTTHLHPGVYEPANANIQAHIASTSDPHSVTKAQVGLGNADNTADVDKPVSTAQQAALDAKVTGPATAVNNRLAAFDLTTGKLIKDSGSTVADFDASGSAAAVQADLDAHKDRDNLHMTSAERSAMDATNAPTGLNPFATINDLSAGGHTIQDPVGTPLPDQPNLQFTGDVNVADDAANNRTVVNVTAGGGSGEANTGSNIGQGGAVFAQKIGVDLQFRRLDEIGAGMNITESADKITFSLNYAGTGISDTIARSDHLHAGIYEPANANIQTHISSTSNPHTVTKAQVGLGNADNTSDADKPVSTAQQAALDAKVSSVVGGLGITVNVADSQNPIVDRDFQIGAYAEKGDSTSPLVGALVIPLDGKSYEASITEDVVLSVSGNQPLPDVSSAVVQMINTGVRAISYPASWLEAEGTLIAFDGADGARNEVVIWTSPDGAVNIAGGPRS